MLSGKKILLGVTGSISAYKAAILVRLLVKAGAEVKVVMTDSAKGFITPLTLATLSKNEVFSQYADEHTGLWSNHVELGLWADMMVIAPASANTIAKMAQGICDNLLLACYLSARCPVFVAPAMDLDMYKHPATQHNLALLTQFGHYLINPAYGELASGLVGEGRLAEPEEIVAHLQQFVSSSNRLKNKKVLITAGPTYENIDPVRFIGNHSSGKMGFSLAAAAANRGAEVVLISGPTNLSTQHPNIYTIAVTSAQEMYDAVMEQYDTCHIAIMSAAVADYRPSIVSNQKMKKNTGSLSIELEATPDILAAMGARKKNQLLIGFALETNNELEHAQQKLTKKNLDFVVLNSLQDPGAGFKHDTNRVTIIGKNKEVKTFELKSKKEVAEDILNTCLI